jgi:hypothetical protein
MRRILLAIGTFSLLATSVAADASHRRWRDRDDVDAGDLIASAIVVGGIAALLSSGSSAEKRRKQDAAVDICAAEAEARARAPVSDIRHVSKRRGYYTVEGELEPGGGAPVGFSCRIRNGTIYHFRTEGGGI